jgi:hypothetical protein
MSTFVYKNDEEFSPSEEQSAELVNQVTNNYKNWDNDRNSQREQYTQIEEAIFIDTTHNERTNDETVLLPQIYEQYNTLKAAIIKSNFQNSDMTFNVQGKNQESQANSALQKANIKDAMKKMNFSKTVEQSLHEYLTKGEMISFTYWETRVEMTRRKVDMEEPLIDPATGQSLGTNKIKKVTNVPKIVFDGAKVASIDPLNFAFDKNEIHNWDSCNKITYSLSSPYDIVANEDYSLLAQDQKDFVLSIANNDEDLNTEKKYTDATSGILGNQVVILEVWGDIKLADGTVLKNYVATIVADTFLARLEPNPYIRNPFAMTQHMPDPSSKRGRSPLLVAVPINQVSSQILNGQIRGLKLTLNPPMLAPMDMFTQDRVALYPGKIIEYNDIYNNGARQPTPYTFKDGLVGFEFLTLMESKIEASTGGFKYMVGSQDSRSRTATETSATVTGQNTRLSMTINIINNEWTIPTIENIAALQANTDFEEKQINMGKQNGQTQFDTITPEIRQGDYEYDYGDSQSVVEMEAKMQKLIAMITQFGDKANFNYGGLVKLIFNKMNIDDADQVLEADPIDEAIQKMSPKPMPPQMLQQMKQEFVDSGMLQQVIQQMMMQQQAQAQGGQPNGQPGQPTPNDDSGQPVEQSPGMAEQNVGTVQQPDMAGTSSLY